MIPVLATELFAAGENGFLVSILILAVLILGLYLWGSRHRSAGGKAEQLQKKYRTLGREQLDRIPDAELVDSVIANLMAKLNRKNPDPYVTIPILSRGRCAVYSVWLTLHELESDGLPAYRRGPSGRFLDLAVEGLELVGAGETAAALRQAKELNAFDEESLLLLQEKALGASAREQPLERCRAYIRANPDEFVDEPPAGGNPEGFDTFAE